VSIKVTSTTYGAENSLKVDGTELIATGSMGNSETKTVTACLAAGSHTIELVDSYGDGWHGGTVEIGSQTFGSDFTSGYSKSYTFSMSAMASSVAAKTEAKKSSWTKLWFSNRSAKAKAAHVAANSALQPRDHA
jgi:hypothetical protein